MTVYMPNGHSRVLVNGRRFRSHPTRNPTHRASASAKHQTKERDTNKENCLFIFGLGYTGLGCANYFQQRGWTVTGTCRDEDKANALCTRGFQAYPFVADGYTQLLPDALRAFQAATHVISTIPPDGSHDPVLSSHAQDFGAAAIDDKLKWVGYISSTGVYGDHSGGWVDETSPLLAAHGNGVSRLLAEAEWLAHFGEFGLPVHIFRCGGIYGPNRSALDAILRSGPPSLSQRRRGQQRFTARCHVLDICQVLEASVRHPNPGAIYNIVDDDPAGRGEVEAFAGALVAASAATQFQEGVAASDRIDSVSSIDITLIEDGGDAVVTRVGAEGSGENRVLDPGETVTSRAPGESALRGEKRVRNALIKRNLGVKLEFPTYREGLTAIFQGDVRPFDWPESDRRVTGNGI